MKKSAQKLMLRSETIRVLRQLGPSDLAHAPGADGQVVALAGRDTQSAECPLAAAVVVTTA